MAIVRFVGNIFPLESDLTISQPFEMRWTEPPTVRVPTGVTMDFRATIQHSTVEVTGTVNPFENAAHIETARCRALDMTKAIVNLYCFSEGMGLTVRIDNFYLDPDPEKKILLMLHPDLRQYCTAFNVRPNPGGLAEFNSVLAMIAKEFAVCMAIDELIVAISTNHQIPVACARAIEGLRKLLAAREEDRGKQWGIFQESLNITRKYREYITNQSTEGRHGDRSHIEAHLLTETLNRSWIITNRFLEFRKRGNTPLIAPEFPLLDG